MMVYGKNAASFNLMSLDYIDTRPISCEINLHDSESDLDTYSSEGDLSDMDDHDVELNHPSELSTDGTSQNKLGFAIPSLKGKIDHMNELHPNQPISPHQDDTKEKKQTLTTPTQEQDNPFAKAQDYESSSNKWDSSRQSLICVEEDF